MKTHSNFKCIFDPCVTDINDTLILFCEDGDEEEDDSPFLHQKDLEKSMLPKELVLNFEGDRKKLDSYEIDVEKIDRLYYECFDYDRYNIIARVDDFNLLYFDLEAFCSYDNLWRGNIFFSNDGKLLVDLCEWRINNENVKALIYESLKEDQTNNNYYTDIEFREAKKIYNKILE